MADQYHWRSTGSSIPSTLCADSVPTIQSRSHHNNKSCSVWGRRSGSPVLVTLFDSMTRVASFVIQSIHIPPPHDIFPQLGQQLDHLRASRQGPQVEGCQGSKATPRASTSPSPFIPKEAQYDGMQGRHRCPPSTFARLFGIMLTCRTKSLFGTSASTWVP